MSSFLTVCENAWHVTFFSFADEPFIAKRLGSPSTADLSSLLDSNEVNDHGDEEHGEGSGVNPGPGPTKEAVHDIVESVRHKRVWTSDEIVSVEIWKTNQDI